MGDGDEKCNGNQSDQDASSAAHKLCDSPPSCSFYTGFNVARMEISEEVGL